MNQDTGKFRKNTKDQYYTKSSVAQKCVQKICEVVPDFRSFQWIEPSAGNGVFLKSLPEDFEKFGIDLEPKSSEIQQGDFLKWIPITSKKRIFFGNPPFGRQSSLAKSFIKHAAQYADYIAFILPRSFVKPSMSRVFPPLFHCIFSEELEKNSFQVNDTEYDVPCIFQIWEKRKINRALHEPILENGFEYVKNNQTFHIALRRVGALAGKCHLSTTDLTKNFNQQTYYFLKFQEIYIPKLQTIMEQINLHVFPSNTVGPRSLSKSEVNEFLNDVLTKFCSHIH